MEVKFFNIIVLFFLVILLVDPELLHKDKKVGSRVDKKNRKKKTHRSRKTIRKGYKIVSDEPIDPEKLDFRFKLDNK